MHHEHHGIVYICIERWWNHTTFFCLDDILVLRWIRNRQVYWKEKITESSLKRRSSSGFNNFQRIQLKRILAQFSLCFFFQWEFCENCISAEHSKNALIISEMRNVNDTWRE